MLKWPTKNVSDALDYTLDWAAQLNAGDTIDTSVWELLSDDNPDELLVLGATSKTSTTTTVRLSAGTAGATYYLLNTIVTVGGSTLTQVTQIRVRKQLEPSPSAFKQKFPEFAAYDTAVISEAIDGAAIFVTTTWPLSTRRDAMLYLAAHFLFLADQESSDTAEMLDRLRTISYGPMNLSLAEAQQAVGGDEGGERETHSTYLERYRMLQPDPWVPIVLDGSHYY